MDELKVEKKPESIREWYDRTTRKARIALAIATSVSICIMTVMWCVASLPTLQKIQTYNGALTVPLIGGLWIFSFIFMFLVPSREASFRAQEALEEGIKVMKDMVSDKVVPAVQIWERIGLQVEKEYPEIKRRIEETVADLKKTSARIEKAIEDNAAFVTDAKPVLEALKRIENRIEQDLLDDLKLAADAVMRMSGTPPKAPVQASELGGKVGFAPSLVEIPAGREPDLGVALSSIQKRKKKEAAEQPK